MSRKRTRYDNKFKVKLVLEVLKSKKRPIDILKHEYKE